MTGWRPQWAAVCAVCRRQVARRLTVWSTEKALTDFLSRLLPPEEVRWTRPLATPLLREDQP